MRAAARRRREERVRDRVPGVPPRVAHRDGRHLQVVSCSVREGFKESLQTKPPVSYDLCGQASPFYIYLWCLFDHLDS